MGDTNKCLQLEGKQVREEKRKMEDRGCVDSIDYPNPSLPHAQEETVQKL